MVIINDRIRIPEVEFTWTFARSGGPGGQNVNKVSSKAILHWDVQGNTTVPADVKDRLRLRNPWRFTRAGELVVSSQRFRDQDRNRQDCLEKLRHMLEEAARTPRKRKATRPSRGAKEARLRTKKHRAVAKSRRRAPAEE